MINIPQVNLYCFIPQPAVLVVDAAALLRRQNCGFVVVAGFPNFGEVNKQLSCPFSLCPLFLGFPGLGS